GLPAALGVKLALPKRPVVALVGDGSAMYTAQALWTAAHESLAVVYVIFNNASYRILKERTKALKGFSAEDDKYVAMDLVDPAIDYIGLARSLGVAGERVEKTADVGPAVGRALASGAPALIGAAIGPLSHGRVDCGLGAGWHEAEAKAYGYAWPGIGVREDMLEEYAQVMRMLFDTESRRSHFAGTHFRLENAPNNPKPLQPRVPIWIGGRGEKRTLRAAAKFADGWNAPYIG